MKRRSVGCVAVVSALLGFSGCAHGAASPATAVPLEAPRVWPSAPVFEPASPAHLSLSAAPFDLTPDGEYRWLVRASFQDAAGAPTTLVHGGNVEFRASRGRVQWQTRFRFGAPAAIVATTERGPIDIDARLLDPQGVPETHVAADTPPTNGVSVVARALGPYVAQVGWFPQVTTGTVRIVRRGSDGSRQLVLVAAPASTYRDATVRPGLAYAYAVRVPGVARADVQRIRIPREPAHTSVNALGGKGMWLSFSPDVRDADAAQRFDPQAMAERAATAGIRTVELRTAYGPFSEVTPAVRPMVDAFVDAATARGIAVIGWTVPRSTAFDDLATSVATTRYRTARGNGFAALAVDLERGDGYLGDGAAGRATIVDYAHRLRQAVGPRYPLIATIEDPVLEGLTPRDFPYADIAANVDALQPMTYWRMLGAGTSSPQGVRAALGRSIAQTRAFARRSLPLFVGGQTSAVGPRGASGTAEIEAAIDAARRLDAKGITFFDWGGTSDAQWDAIARTTWAQPIRDERTTTAP